MRGQGTGHSDLIQPLRNPRYIGDEALLEDVVMRLKFLVPSLACAALLAGAPAAAGQQRSLNPELAASVDRQFTVVEENARVSFPTNITRYEILEDDSLLVTFGANRRYRVKLGSDCARDLRNASALAFLPSGSGHFDTFSHVAVRGVSCQVQTIDRVQRRET